MDAIIRFLQDTGFYLFSQDGNWRCLIMLGIACVLLYLGIVKKFEPLLLVPIAFGMLITNLPGANMFHEIFFAGGHIHWDLIGGQPVTASLLADLHSQGVAENVLAPYIQQLMTAAQTTFSPEMVEQAIAAGQETLAQTIDMNPVLKKAGVVDAGGKGYLIILEGMLSSLRGEPMPEVEEEPEHDKADFAAIGDEDITFAFDTVFIVRKNDPNVDLAPFRAYLDSIGDSLVIGEDDESFKVHVHTDTPGEALTAAQRYGTLELAKIENMRTQAADLAAGRKAQSTDDLDAIEAELEQAEQAEVPAEKRYGFLAVCAGDGLAAAFRDLGVDRVVSGGQTMNPSTEAILREVNHTPSEIVFVLPNNKNIVMAAQQCVGLTEKQVIVVPTHSIPQGISAMMSVDTAEEDPQAILAAMTEAAAAVTTAQITYAARNSDFDGFAINEGDYLALLDGKLFGTERDITSLLTRLAALAAEREAAFVTLFYGEGVSQEEAEAAQALFTEACPETEISLLSGGQPVYYYTISIE